MLRSLCIALCLALALPAAAKPRVTRVDPPKAVLFVGNSFNYYNNSMHGHLRLLDEAADPAHAKDYTFKSLTISGAYLAEHAGAMPLVVKSRHWDVVVLQGQSTEPMATDKARSERFRAVARQYDEMIRASGAKTALFMTWAY